MWRNGFWIFAAAALSACSGGSNSQGEATSSSSSSSSENSPVIITASASGQGMVTPATLEVAQGESAQLTIFPDPGYELAEVDGCSGELQELLFTTDALQEPCELTVSFAMKELVAPDLDAVYQANRTVAFSWAATGNAYYQLVKVSGGGNEELVANDIEPSITQFSYQIFAPADHSASFKLLSCTAEMCASSEVVSPDGDIANSVEYLQQEGLDGYVSNGFGYGAIAGAASESAYVPSFYISESFLGHASSDLVVFSPGEFGDMQRIERLDTGLIERLTIDLAEQNIFISSTAGLSSAAVSDYIEWYKNDGSEWLRQDSHTMTLERHVNSLTVSEDGKLLALAVAPYSLASDGETEAAVWLYRVGEELMFLASVAPTQMDANDKFGAAIDLSENGEILVVGAPGEDSGLADGAVSPTNNFQNQSGAAYVFRRDGDTWQQERMLKSPNPRGRWWDCYAEECVVSPLPERASGDSFGSSVSVTDDGSLVAVGAPMEVQGQGAVHLYRALSDSSWQHVERLQLDYPDSKVWLSPAEYIGGDQFGYSVSISGDGEFLAVGAPFEQSAAVGLQGNSADNSKSNSGAAMLYKLGSSGVLQSTYIKSTNPEAEYFGRSVDLTEGDNRIMVIAEEHGVSVY